MWAESFYSEYIPLLCSIPGLGLGAVFEEGCGLPIVNTYHWFVHSLAWFGGILSKWGGVYL